mgnify:CR=1 FL=1
MRILITGVTGFAGGHLAELLAAAGERDLHGVSRSAVWPIPLAHLERHVHLHAADLADLERVESLLRDVQPDQIYHLAGYAAAGASFAEPQAAWFGNVGVAHALFDALNRSHLRPRIVFVSSALIYAPPDSPRAALDEAAPIAPLNPYAESKAAADRLAEEAATVHGFDVVRVRPFNHIGPRQSPQFAVASFAQQLARIELGLAPPRLETGDLTARRDFTDVRDMVQAYRLVMKHGVSGQVYNAGSGIAISVAEIVDRLRLLCRVPVEVVTAADRLRPSDAPVLIADATRLRRLTGWRPAIPLEQTLADTLEFWRAVERGDSTPAAQSPTLPAIPHHEPPP